MQNAVLSSIEMELRSAEKRRHWSSSSQPYAPADVLLDYLADGWNIRSVVGQEVCWRGGGRHIIVHYFELTRNDRVMAMPVLDNPVVRRLVGQRQRRVDLLKWMLADDLRMRSPRRDHSSIRMLDAGTRPAWSRPRPIHSAMNEVKLVHSSEV